MYWLVTFVTHDSTVSDRTRRFGVKPGIATILPANDQVMIAEALAQALEKHSIAVLSFNVIPDHAHMIMAADSESHLAEHVRRLRGYSAYVFRKRHHLVGSGHLWAEKFNRRPIRDANTLQSMLGYVSENHVKHAARWGPVIEITWIERIRPIVDSVCGQYAEGLFEVL